METTSQIEENIKRLNNLNKLGQLGGKGTIRRKKLKRTGKMKYTHPKCKDEILLEELIDESVESFYNYFVNLILILYN